MQVRNTVRPGVLLLAPLLFLLAESAKPIDGRNGAGFSICTASKLRAGHCMNDPDSTSRSGTAIPRAVAIASNVLNVGDCPPFSSRTSVTRPISAASARAACVSPAASLNWRMRPPSVPLHCYRLDYWPVGHAPVTIAPGSPSRDSTPFSPRQPESRCYQGTRKRERNRNHCLPPSYQHVSNDEQDCAGNDRDYSEQAVAVPPFVRFLNFLPIGRLRERRRCVTGLRGNGRLRRR